MAYSKVILNGVTLMDVTQKTVEANKMLSGTTALKNDGTDITGSVSSKAAATYTPTTSSQTIAAGQYLSGAQTISGDANLVAENIKKDVAIFGVTGTYEGGGGGGSTAKLTVSPAPYEFLTIPDYEEIIYYDGVDVECGRIIQWGEMMGGTTVRVSPVNDPATVYTWIVYARAEGPITDYRMVVPNFDCTITVT